MSKLPNFASLVVGASLLGAAGLCHAQAVAAVAMMAEAAKKIGVDKICNLSDVPGGVTNPKPTTAEHRAALYLRCEAMGGGVPPPDGLAKASCCEHLRPGELSSCPDARPEINVPARQALWAVLTCPKP